MRLFYFFFVTFFFGGIVKVQNVVITQEDDAPKENAVVGEIILEYEQMVARFQGQKNELEEEMQVPVVEFTSTLKPRGYEFLKIVNGSELSDNDLKIYMDTLYKYFSKLMTKELARLEAEKKGIEAEKESIEEATRHLGEIEKNPEDNFTLLYQKYFVQEEKNVSNLIKKIKERVNDLKLLKDKVRSLDTLLLIKLLPKFFDELLKVFEAKETLLKDSFDKIKELNGKLKAEDIDAYKRQREAEIPELERKFNEAFEKVKHLITTVKPSLPDGGAEPPLPSDSPAVGPVAPHTDGGNGNPSGTPSDGTDPSHSSDRSEVSLEEEKQKIKEHQKKISELLENYKQKVIELSSKKNPNDKSIKDGNISDIVDKDFISKVISDSKNNEGELAEVIGQLETLVTQMQIEKAAMDKIYNKLEKGEVNATDAEIAASVASAEMNLKDFSELKDRAKQFLTELAGKSSNALRRTSNEMMLAIRNVIAILMILTFIL